MGDPMNAGPVPTQWRPVDPPDPFGNDDYSLLVDHYTWRENPDTHLLEWRMINVDDPEGKFEGDTWATAGRYGPPNLTARWDHLVQKWGLHLLEYAGFINAPHQSMDSGSIKGRFHTLHLDNIVHPILRRDMWDGLDDGSVGGIDEYNTMEHSMRLASAILDEPETLRFFGAFLNQQGYFKTQYSEKVGNYDTFDCLPPLVDEDARIVYDSVVKMRDYLRWTIVDSQVMLDQKALAMTGPWPMGDGTLKVGHCAGTRSSIIQISRGYLDCLKLAGSDPDQYERNLDDFMWNRGLLPGIPIPIDSMSSVFRCVFALAQTILHEFGHAYCAAFYKPRQLCDLLTGEPIPNSLMIEPIFRSDRSSEVGLAVTGWEFGLSVQGYSSRGDEAYYHPFGMQLVHPYDVWYTNRMNGFGNTTVDDIDYINATQLHYPVMQNHINSLFSHNMWAHRVPRWGLDALRFPAYHNWVVSEKRTHPSLLGISSA